MHYRLSNVLTHLIWTFGYNQRSSISLLRKAMSAVPAMFYRVDSARDPTRLGEPIEIVPE